MRSAASLLALLAGVSAMAGPTSGLKLGEFASAFEPHHVSGADKGTDTCPVCKYGLLPGVLVWVNGEHPEQAIPLAKTLDAKLSKVGTDRLRAFFVFYNPGTKSASQYKADVAAMAAKAGLKRVAFTVLDSPKAEPVEAYKISADPAVKTTVLVYKKLRVKSKWVNYGGTAADQKALGTALDAVLKPS